VVNFPQLVFIDDQVGEFLEGSEAYEFIPTLDAVLLQVQISQVFEVVFRYLELRTNLFAIIPYEIELFYVYESRS
jgi:hypothetical protein